MLEHDRIPEPDPRSWVRVTTLEAESPDQLRLAMRFVAEQAVPAIRDRPGWKGALALESPDGRRGLTLVFWDSLETLVASAQDSKSFYESAAAAGVNVVTGVERFEVVLDERPD